MGDYSLQSYRYELPESSIAQEALHPHHDAKLMVIDRQTGRIKNESTFWNLDTCIAKDTVIFFNNSRVLRARIRLHEVSIEAENGQKGMIHEGEILFCSRQVKSENFEALVRPGNKFKIGTKIFFGNIYLEVISMTENGRILRAVGEDIDTIMERYGELPLPPYIEYSASKEGDYQTVFAEKSGSVAAPTASLHFTEALLEKLPQEKMYTTLHVGLGTFKSVDTEDIREYHIHKEQIEVDFSLFSKIAKLKQSERNILAVGTTVCRTLESLPYVWKELSLERISDFDEDTVKFWNSITSRITDEEYISGLSLNFELGSLTFETKIFLYPGKEFFIVDELITNFHLPESSLLMLVGAFIEKDELLKIYRYAIEHGYRFFSFGDGMYIRNFSR